MQWIGRRVFVGKRIVSAMLSLFLQPSLVQFVFVIFMGEVATGYYLQAAEDHDVTLIASRGQQRDKRLGKVERCVSERFVCKSEAG